MLDLPTFEPVLEQHLHCQYTGRHENSAFDTNLEVIHWRVLLVMHSNGASSRQSSGNKYNQYTIQERSRLHLHSGPIFDRITRLSPHLTLTLVLALEQSIL